MEPSFSHFARATVIRLFRIWAMAKEKESESLPPMFELASDLNLPDDTAAACDSLFALVENPLGRPLVRESCCARTFSADEKALIGLIEAAPSIEAGRGTQRLPHGLPGAILWAAMAARRALRWSPPGSHGGPEPSGREACPFEANGRARLAV